MSGDTASSRLLTKMALAHPVLAAEGERIWTSPRVRDYYLLYLRTMHMIVRAAVPLMMAARDRASSMAAHDPVAAALVDYFEEHAREEAGHDRWILEDLAAAGADADEAVRAIPSPRIANYVGAQYYWLYHYHPVALLGHIGALETYHPQPGFAARLRDLTGLPRSAFRAVARHEVLDLRHKEELYSLLDRLGLSAEQETMIGISALHTIDCGILVLREMLETPQDGPGGNHSRPRPAPDLRMVRR